LVHAQRNEELRHLFGALLLHSQIIDAWFEAEQSPFKNDSTRQHLLLHTNDLCMNLRSITFCSGLATATLALIPFTVTNVPPELSSLPSHEIREYGNIPFLRRTALRRRLPAFRR
jgi:hypothetical protein